MNELLNEISSLCENDYDFRDKLTQFVREHKLLKTGFDLYAIPFKEDTELMLAFDLATRSDELSKHWEKILVATEERDGNPDNRHKKMAYTKVRKTFYKLLEKLGFVNAPDGFGGVEAQWVWLWFENGCIIDETIFSEATQADRKIWFEEKKTAHLKKY